MAETGKGLNSTLAQGAEPKLDLTPRNSSIGLKRNLARTWTPTSKIRLKASLAEFQRSRTMRVTMSK